LKYLSASFGMIENKKGVIHFTKEGMELLDEMLKEFALKKSRKVKQQ